MSKQVRQALGSQLVAYYALHVPPLSLDLVDLLARYCVAEAMAEFDRKAA